MAQRQQPPATLASYSGGLELLLELLDVLATGEANLAGEADPRGAWRTGWNR
jgi:hypothetical protein